MKLKHGLLLITASALCLPACTTQQMLSVATAKDPEKALRNVAQHRANSYKYNPELVLSDMKKVKSEYDRLMGNVQKESGTKWGKHESGVLANRTRYVKYTENYKNRVVVDYDAGTVLIEHLDEEKAKEKLRNAAVVALLTPDDPGSVDLFSDKEIELATSWLAELARDPSEALAQTWTARLKTATDGLQTACTQRDQAVAALGPHHTSVALLVGEVNAELDRLEGDLKKLFPGDANRVASYLAATRSNYQKGKGEAPAPAPASAAK